MGVHRVLSELESPNWLKHLTDKKINSSIMAEQNVHEWMALAALDEGQAIEESTLIAEFCGGISRNFYRYNA